MFVFPIRIQRTRLLGILVTGLLYPWCVLAQELANQQADGRIVVLFVLKIVWAVVFFVAFGLAIFSYRKFKEQEEEDLIERAKQKNIMIVSLGITAGSILILAVLFIVGFIIEKRLTIPFLTSSAHGTGSSITALGTQFGEYEKIASVYPEANQTNVPRNTKIIVTFKDPIDPSSIALADGSLKADAVRIQPVSDTNSDAGSTGGGARVTFTSDNSVATFSPLSLLGEENKKIPYAVTLTAGIRAADGSRVFTTAQGYTWQFEVSGFVDTIPPFVQSIVPFSSSGDAKTYAAPNSLIQITFSEAIDPVSITPRALQIFDETAQKNVVVIPTVANNYRTVTITPRVLCGQNVCNENIYCFEKNTQYRVTTRAATLAQQGAAASSEFAHKAAVPYDGIVDLAGNSLDGGGLDGIKRDARSQGTPVDDYISRFRTSDTMDVTQPVIVSINPGRDMTRIRPMTTIEVVFSKFMDVQSFNRSTIQLRPKIEHWVSAIHDMETRRTKLDILHHPFAADTVYSPEILSGVRDSTQQCFSQCIGPR